MKFSRLALASVLALGAAGASAVQVTVVGSNFDITYDDAFVGLFGTPVISGTQVAWFPSGSPGFTAQTASGFGVANSTFALKVSAHPGFQLSGFSLTEGGDYFFFGNGSTVAVSGQLRVTPLPGSTTTTPIAATAPFVANGLFDFATTDWTGATSTIAVQPGTTLANVTVQNILASFVPAGSLGYAFIEKKEAFLTVGVSPIPEPQTYAMFAAGLGVVAFVAMRRRSRR